MESFFIRYRNLLVLLAVLVAQLMGLAVQVRRAAGGRSSLDTGDGSGVRLIRLWAEAVVLPAERAIHGVKTGSEHLWTSYIDLTQVSQQNKDLERTVERLRLEQASLLEDARQGQRLQALLGFQQKYIYNTLAAQAIGSSGSDQSRVFYVDKGSKDGLKADMAVITGDGVVGKVRDVFPHSAQVLAINDQTSGAGVILETTRIRGILRGNAAGQLMIVGILADERIQPGEIVLTAGGDLVFPRGLPVGVVDKVVRDPQRDAFIDVMVKPAAHLDRLDEVLILTSLEPRFGPQEQKDIDTSELLKGPEAAAIKDQAARDEAARQQAIRDQAIRDQMKASQIMAERLPGLTDANAPATPAPGAQTAAKPGQAPGPAAPPAPKLLPAQHPDRFTPGAAPAAIPESDSNSAARSPQNGGSTATGVHPDSKPASKASSQSAPKPGSRATTGTESNPGAPPRRNP